VATHGEKRWPPAGRFNGRLRGAFHGHRHCYLGIHPETLRKRVRRAQADSGERPDLLSSEEREEIRRLRREVSELRRANEILRSASVFFAKELDQDRTR